MLIHAETDENALGATRDELVIVGGWVPDLLYPTSNHMGSLNVDLAVSPRAIGENAYSYIRERLTKIGYTLHESPTRFFKHLPGLANPIKIDLITGLYVSQQKQDSILVDEIRINALRGIDLAFEASETITIDGRMPDGSGNQVTARLVAPSGIHLDQGYRVGRTKQRQGRLRHCISLNHYQPSLADLAGKVHRFSRTGIGKEALQLLRAKSRTFESVGPVWAGRAAATAGDDLLQFQRAAFEDADALYQHSPYTASRIFSAKRWTVFAYSIQLCSLRGGGYLCSHSRLIDSMSRCLLAGIASARLNVTK